jgi:hypothetical protein
MRSVLELVLQTAIPTFNMIVSPDRNPKPIPPGQIIAAIKPSRNEILNANPLVLSKKTPVVVIKVASLEVSRNKA